MKCIEKVWKNVHQTGIDGLGVAHTVIFHMTHFRDVWILNELSYFFKKKQFY